MRSAATLVVVLGLALSLVEAFVILPRQAVSGCVSRCEATTDRGSCISSNFTCLCSYTPWYDGLSECVAQNCTLDDEATVQTTYGKICEVVLENVTSVATATPSPSSESTADHTTTIVIAVVTTVLGIIALLGGALTLWCCRSHRGCRPEASPNRSYDSTTDDSYIAHTIDSGRKSISGETYTTEMTYVKGSLDEVDVTDALPPPPYDGSKIGHMDRKDSKV